MLGACASATAVAALATLDRCGAKLAWSPSGAHCAALSLRGLIYVWRAPCSVSVADAATTTAPTAPTTASFQRNTECVLVMCSPAIAAATPLVWPVLRIDALRPARAIATATSAAMHTQRSSLGNDAADAEALCLDAQGHWGGAFAPLLADFGWWSDDGATASQALVDVCLCVCSFATHRVFIFQCDFFVPCSCLLCAAQ